jgi:hypothetical protein
VKKTRDLARVTLIEAPESDWEPGGPVTSKQEADVTLPREELDRIWSPEYLERLARTYWSFLTRFSLGILRVVYGESSREVVVLTRPFVLLRFHKPEYETNANGGAVGWPIERGLLVAPAGRGRGYLRLAVSRDPHAEGEEVVTTVSSEVVNFYPLIAGWGWFARIGQLIYNQTQLRIHVIVTHSFLRSLANLDLAESRVGSFSRAALPRSPAASPDRGER